MKRIYTTPDLLMLGHLKNVLESHGIDCLVKNLHLTGLAGQLPPIECWPELWIVKDEQWTLAKSVLERALKPLTPVNQPWKCAKCGEEIEGQFNGCWRCGSARTGAT